MKLYVTDTSGKNFNMQHCIVNLYKSVSKREMTPSGKFAGAAMMLSVLGTVLWQSTIAGRSIRWRCWRGGGAGASLCRGRRTIVGPVTVDAQEKVLICTSQKTIKSPRMKTPKPLYTPRRDMLREP